MKYIDAEKLKEECKKVTEKSLLELGQYPYMRMIVLEYHEHIDKIIDSLQQEQKKVDLRKEIDACWQNWLSPSNQKEVEGVLPKTEFAMYARHFYVLGRQEQPEVDLEKEYKTWWDSIIGKINVEHMMEWYMHETARHFYELGLNARKEG